MGEIIENLSQTVPKLLLIRDLLKDDVGEDKVLLENIFLLQMCKDCYRFLL